MRLPWKSAGRSVVHRSRTSGLSLQSRLHSATATSVNPDEISHFSRLSSQWWDEKGEFGLLHRMNPVRMQFIREKLLEVSRDEALDSNDELEIERKDKSGRILDGLDVLDVGCGGGLLSESLARLGARTVGVDASSSNIAIASLHASLDPELSSTSSGQRHRQQSLEYRHASAEDLLDEPKKFDIVCSMEVLEHVDNPADFLRSCAELVKPGGHLFLSTISRTPLSYFLTVLAAEHVLRLVAPGTHTYSKYVNPSELIDFFSKPLTNSRASNTMPPVHASTPWITRLYNGVPSRREAEVRGMAYLPWKGEWALAPRGAWGSTGCNYLFWVQKPGWSERI